MSSWYAIRGSPSSVSEELLLDHRPRSATGANGRGWPHPAISPAASAITVSVLRLRGSGIRPSKFWNGRSRDCGRTDAMPWYRLRHGPSQQIRKIPNWKTARARRSAFARMHAHDDLDPPDLGSRGRQGKPDDRQVLDRKSTRL